MKINIHTDQLLGVNTTQPPRLKQSSSNNGTSPGDQTSASVTASNIQAGLDTVAGARAARVSNLTALYASGRYTVNSAQLAQTLVSGALGRH